MPKRPKSTVGTTIGGILAGVDQQIFRATPPAQELVHHARPDDAVAAGDGSTISVTLPGDADRGLAAGPVPMLPSQVVPPTVAPPDTIEEEPPGEG